MSDSAQHDRHIAPTGEGRWGPIVEALDFLYTPSRDEAADTAELTAALGGRLVFTVDHGGVRVAMIELPGSPPLLLTDHLDGDRPILVCRVADLRAATAALAERGWTTERSLEIPMGPCASFRSSGGHRIALYQATRPGVARQFEGRRDF